MKKDNSTDKVRRFIEQISSPGFMSIDSNVIDVGENGGVFQRNWNLVQSMPDGPVKKELELELKSLARKMAEVLKEELLFETPCSFYTGEYLSCPNCFRIEELGVRRLIRLLKFLGEEEEARKVAERAYRAGWSVE